LKTDKPLISLLKRQKSYGSYEKSSLLPTYACARTRAFTKFSTIVTLARKTLYFQRIIYSDELLLPQKNVTLELRKVIFALRGVTLRSISRSAETGIPIRRPRTPADRPSSVRTRLRTEKRMAHNN